jgi:hypothetical protein|nr:MAG TPA: hypothetical protein [Caudoviricetes sp.]
MAKDNLKLKGAIHIVLRHADGKVETRRKDNLILNGGFDFICAAIAGSSRPPIMGFTAVGTGTTSVVENQSKLISEISRKAASYAHTAGTKVFTLTTNFAAGEATGAITEAGICNAASGGTFLDRVTFDVINKAADDTMQTTFQFTLS